MRLILIRHGETPWNALGRLQGAIDIPLSEHGHWQAQRLAARLRDEPIAALVSSDLARAQQTAAPLAEALGLPVRPEPRLRERSYGIFEGQTHAGLAQSYPAEWARHQAREIDWVVPGGESIAQLRERVLAALAELAREHAGQTVVTVAHGGVLDVVYRFATGLSWGEPRSYALPNAGINRLELSAQPFTARLARWAELDHLDESAAPRDELRVV